MKKKTLYRTKNSNGEVIVSPEKPADSSFTKSYRLIADEDKVITDGVNNFYCIDTDEPDKYTEIDEPEEESEEEVMDEEESEEEVIDEEESEEEVMDEEEFEE